MLKELLVKLFGSSYTALTNAWNFHDLRVEYSSMFSLAITAFFTGISINSKNYLGISGVMLVMVVVIITTDFVTGITAAYRQEQKLRRPVICAAKGIRSAYKLGVYIVFLFCMHTLVKEFEGSWVSSIIRVIHAYVTIHIFFWESFSVDENLKTLGVDLGLRNFFKKILSLFQKKAEDLIDTDSKKEQE